MKTIVRMHVDESRRADKDRKQKVQEEAKRLVPLIYEIATEGDWQNVEDAIVRAKKIVGQKMKEQM